MELFYKPEEKEKWSDDVFIAEVSRRAADYDAHFMGRVIGYMDRLADEIGEKK